MIGADYLIERKVVKTNFPQVGIHKETGGLVVIYLRRWLDYGAGSESFFQVQYGKYSESYHTRLNLDDYILIGEFK